MYSCAPSSPLHIVIVMPLRDDWVPAAELIRRIDDVFQSTSCAVELLIVDDRSIQDCAPGTFYSQYSVIRSIYVLHLTCNLGHQRAIAIGLAHVEHSMPCDAVLVMDADGEDTPSGALSLVNGFAAGGGKMAIFAARSKRLESWWFRASYFVFRVLHRLLTGRGIQVGNFSVLPSGYLKTVLTLSNLWNHYAAALFRSGLPSTMIPIPRGRRLAGTSRMNFVALVTHGLSAISVFGDIVGVRLLIASIGGLLIAATGIFAVFALRMSSSVGLPGWAMCAIGILLVIFIQFMILAAAFTFFILSNRSTLGFMPVRDYLLFVGEIEEIYRVE